jgi:type I restriction enzyme S subunit
LYLTPEYLRGKGNAESVKPSANAVFVEDGETIVLWDGSNAGEIFRAKKGVLASTMSRVSHGDEYDPDYFYYALKGWEEYLKGQTSGSGIPHVDKEVLGKLQLFEFVKPEQTKIAGVLSTVDRAIEQTEALIAKQQRIKTGLMQDLLTKGIDEHGNLRSEATHEFKDSPLGRIPVEWDVEPIGVRVQVKGGKRLPSGHDYAEGDTGFRYLRTMDFINRKLSHASLNYLHPKTFRILERYEIVNGDVFISIAGVNLGVAGVFRPVINDRTILTENAAKLSLITDESPEYFAQQINGPLIQKEILEDKGIGAGVPKLALHRIASFAFPWPSKDEQELIVSHLSRLQIGVEEQQQSLTKLRATKNALMQDLLTGKKRVTPLLDADEALAAEA